ncbi:hypothetical protein U1Q18_045856, partial [Sarracenia purpurea var. burkii]
MQVMAILSTIRDSPDLRYKDGITQQRCQDGRYGDQNPYWHCARLHTPVVRTLIHA